MGVVRSEWIRLQHFVGGTVSQRPERTGNLMSFAGMPCVCRYVRMAEDCDDFSERSRPSMMINALRFASVVIELCLGGFNFWQH